MSKSNKFWELLEESIIVQSTVTLIVVSTVCYLYATEGEVPDALLAIASIVLGFWFKAKNQHEIKRLSGPRAQLSGAQPKTDETDK